MFGRKKQQTLLKKKLVVSGVTVILISGTAFYAIKLLSRPVEGVINEQVNEKPVLQEIAPKILNSDYFSLTYPGRYELQASDDNFASLQSWILIAHQAIGLGQASKISISVAVAPVGGVTEDSAYKLFAAFPETYTIKNTSYGGEPVVVGLRSDASFEHTVLWLHGSKLLTVSLTAGGETEQLIAELELILQSVNWL